MFTKFQSLINESFKNVGGFLTDPLFSKRLVTVTEKIHGANFSIYLTKDGIKCFASRSQTMPLETNFMNCKRFFTDELVRAIKQRCSILIREGVELRIIGEIFGGLDVAGIKAVQREIHYAGDIDFKVFHVQCKLETGEWYDYNWEQTVRAADQFHLKAVPIIATDLTFEESYALDTKVKSKLSDKDQFCEGFCIRADSVIAGEPPLIFKKRNTEFLENKGTPKSVKNTGEQSELAIKALTSFSVYATPQRVNNVNSHHGFKALKDFPVLLNLVIEDAFSDFEKEQGFDLRKEPVYSEIHKKIGSLFVPLIKQELSK